jgi:hypothetical protein
MQDQERKTMTEILREAFASDGRSIYQLARDADMPYPVLYRFIKGDKNGRKRSLDLITADKLADALRFELRPKKR